MIRLERIILTSLAMAISYELACAPNFKPDNTEFAWDCHHVLLKPRIGSMIKISFLQVGPHALKIAGALCYESIRYCLNGAPSPTYQMLSGIRDTLRTPHVTAVDFKQLLDNYDACLWPVILKILSQYDPIPGMQEIIQELHALGYTQRAATNMSSLEFNAARQENPHLFEHFHADNHTVSVQPLDSPRKPSLGYFDQYHERYNPTKNKNIVFIDDKDENVHAARLAGMIAITFKNAQQLRTDLKNHGISVA